MGYNDPDKKKEYNRLYRLKNIEKFKEYERNRIRVRSKEQRSAEHAKVSKESLMFSAAKHRAKTKEIEFSIKLQDIVIPEFCPILGIRLQSNIGGKGPIKSSPNLDRIDNSKGYTKDNIAVISSWANQRKGDLSIEEITKLFEYVTKKDHK